MNSFSEQITVIPLACVCVCVCVSGGVCTCSVSFELNNDEIWMNMDVCSKSFASFSGGWDWLSFCLGRPSPRLSLASPRLSLLLDAWGASFLGVCRRGQGIFVPTAHLSFSSCPAPTIKKALYNTLSWRRDRQILITVVEPVFRSQLTTQTKIFVIVGKSGWYFF